MSFPATLPTAALSGKAAAGLAVALLAVGGASAATISATASGGRSTSSVNTSAPVETATNPPDSGTSSAFGQQVKAQVALCKANLSAGQHGIGSCVSAWVTANNPGHTGDHPTADATNPTDAPPKTPVGSRGSHPTGAPVSHPGH